MGVADITSRCAPRPFSDRAARWATPKRCCSSVMTMPRRANSVVWDSRAWVPMASSACPPCQSQTNPLLFPSSQAPGEEHAPDAQRLQQPLRVR